MGQKNWILVFLLIAGFALRVRFLHVKCAYTVVIYNFLSELFSSHDFCQISFPNVASYVCVSFYSRRLFYRGTNGCIFKKEVQKLLWMIGFGASNAPY